MLLAATASALAVSMDSPLTPAIVLMAIWVLRRDIVDLVNWRTGKVRKEKDAMEERFKKNEDAIGQFVDKDALDQRFSEMRKSIHDVGAVANNVHNENLEIVRERERLHGEIKYRLDTHEKELRSLEDIPGRVKSLEEKFTVIKEDTSEIKRDLKDLPNQLEKTIGLMIQAKVK